MNKETLQKYGWGLFVVVFIAVFAFMILTDDFEHIEDTNGPNNYSIQRITIDDIVNDDMGSKGLTKTKTDFEVGGVQFGGVTYESKKYSGVSELLYTNYIFDSTFSLTIYEYEIKEGNFELVVVNNDKIVGKFTPELASTLVIDNLKGKVSIKAVGESANFHFKMMFSDYNEYGNYDGE